MACRSRYKDVQWRTIEGAFAKPRRLYLVSDPGGVFQCPIRNCDHIGFKSQRGCRKHVKKIHGWYIYFDSKPNISTTDKGIYLDEEQQPSRPYQNLPSYPKEHPLRVQFVEWLKSTGGGGRTASQAEQDASRAFKFLRYCCENFSDIEEQDLNMGTIDYCLGSSVILADFMDATECVWNLGFSSRINYLNVLQDLIDFRKFSGASPNIVHNFSVSETFFKRARKCLRKQRRIQWSNDFDIDNLESAGCWATMEELQSVIPFHIQRYKDILNDCKNDKDNVRPAEISFATKFIATYLFIKVKGTRPMTYQYLTLDMIKQAKKNGGYIDQKVFKTASNYGFDSLVIDKTSRHIIDDFVKIVRPLSSPKCNYLLINRNGLQHNKLTHMMSQLVFEAIGKYINPTRYRQIIETESVQNLSPDEQKWVTEDQKHSSNVARTHYQKKRSRDIALKGQCCMSKLRGKAGEVLDKSRRNQRVKQNLFF